MPGFFWFALIVTIFLLGLGVVFALPRERRRGEGECDGFGNPIEGKKGGKWKRRRILGGRFGKKKAAAVLVAGELAGGDAVAVIDGLMDEWVEEEEAIEVAEAAAELAEDVLDVEGLDVGGLDVDAFDAVGAGALVFGEVGEEKEKKVGVGRIKKVGAVGVAGVKRVGDFVRRAKEKVSGRVRRGGGKRFKAGGVGEVFSGEGARGIVGSLPGMRVINFEEVEGGDVIGVNRGFESLAKYYGLAELKGVIKLKVEQFSGLSLGDVDWFMGRGIYRGKDTRVEMDVDRGGYVLHVGIGGLEVLGLSEACIAGMVAGSDGLIYEGVGFGFLERYDFAFVLEKKYQSKMSRRVVFGEVGGSGRLFIEEFGDGDWGVRMGVVLGREDVVSMSLRRLDKKEITGAGWRVDEFSN